MEFSLTSSASSNEHDRDEYVHGLGYYVLRAMELANQRANQVYPKEHVTPERKVMVRSACDYTGILQSDSFEIRCIYLPYDIDMKRGIFYSKGYDERAVNDCIEYCKTHKLYPVTSALQNYLDSLGKTNLKVKRSNGKIQDDFNLVLNRILKNCSNDWYIICGRSSEEIEKGVMISELCELNDIDETKVWEILEQSLIEHYDKYLINIT